MMMRFGPLRMDVVKTSTMMLRMGRFRQKSPRQLALSVLEQLHHAFAGCLVKNRGQYVQIRHSPLHKGKEMLGGRRVKWPGISTREIDRRSVRRHVPGR